MTRYVIHNKQSGQFLKGSGKHKEWVDSLDQADLYKQKLTSLWWNEDMMELVPVNIVIVEA